MNILMDVPNIKVVQNGKSIIDIKTVLKFNEDEDKVIMSALEYIPIFKRGFTCDMELEFSQESIEEDKEPQNLVYDKISDLVLVHIRKSCVGGSDVRYEYVFYK